MERIKFSNSQTFNLDMSTESRRYLPSSKLSNENHSPLLLPSTLSSMLKNTTETGDIGQFSIKPSRLSPQGPSPRTYSLQNAAHGHRKFPRQRPQYDFLCSMPPMVDDRRRLPSYNRDINSEGSSILDTASQNSSSSSRVFEDPGSHAYSITQTSPSSLSLSNHRSFASLRSQPDLASIVQRPRSPFAYPARLKRPGFRPSSPAFAAGGTLDYSLRATERIQTGSKAVALSSSLVDVGHKNQPSLGLRPEIYKSTTSLQRQSSSQSHKHSRPGTYESTSEWSNIGEISVRASPARSTLSLASTSNTYQQSKAASMTLTPSKVSTPSPLYYDYTEEFDVEQADVEAAADTVTLEPPPLFQLEQTIHEDRVLSTCISSTSDKGMLCDLESALEPEICINGDLNLTKSREIMACDREITMTLVHSQNFKPLHEQWDAMGKIEQNSWDHEITAYGTIGGGPVNDGKMQGNRAENDRHMTVVPPIMCEGLISSSPPPPFITPKSLMEDRGHDDAVSDADLSNRLSAHLKDFPEPPRSSESIFNSLSPVFYWQSDADVNSVLTQSKVSSPPSGPAHTHDSMRLQPANPFMIPPTLTTAISSSTEDEMFLTLSQQSHSIQGCHKESKDTQLIATTDIKKVLIETEGSPTRPEVILNHQWTYCAPCGRSTGVNTLPCGLPLPCKPDSPFEMISTVSRFCSDGDLRSSVEKTMSLETLTYQPYQKTDLKCSGGGIPNFSHQFPRKSLSRSNSPLLAPTAISPVQELRLKISVPQLMKALPPIPYRDPIHQIHGVPQSSAESPSKQNLTTPQDPKSKLDKATIYPVEIDPIRHQPKKVEQRARGLLDTQSSSSNLPKLRLKTRSSIAMSLRPLSPVTSRPWNLDESYPWTMQEPSVRISSVVSSRRTSGILNPPKFKLKAKRVSDKSGTVRIKKGANRYQGLSGLNLSNPKDLFTPTSALQDVFRHVSKQFGSKLRITPMELNNAPVHMELSLATISDGISLETRLFREASLSHAPLTTTFPLSPTDVRSFFSDDSSQIQGQNSLRKRISNLRARIPVPYSSSTRSTGTRSSDDLFGQRQVERNLSRSRFQSCKGSNENMPEVENHIQIQRRKLKVKVADWFKSKKVALENMLREAATMGNK